MSALPPLYAAWMEKVLPGRIPTEGKATCDSCAMCAHSDDPPGKAALFFNPQTKCCTYLPELYNFLAGGVLADEDPALGKGVASVEARLEAKIEVTPFGLGQFPTYTLLSTHNTNAFGHSRTLRCPHYLEEEGGRCGIWRHRNAVCMTWFCKHERGATGQRFWQTLVQLLTRVEIGLSRWCVLELDIGIRALERLFPLESLHRERLRLDARQLDHVVDPRAYRLIWGKWWNREREFYRECARLVNDLSWEDVTRICGPEVLAFSRLTQEAYDRLTSSQIPEAVRLNPTQIAEMGLDSVQVKGYSPHDPLNIPRKLFEVLPYLEGEPTSKALQRIETEKGLVLGRNVVRKLIDFGILIAVPEEEQPRLPDLPRSVGEVVSTA